MKKIKLMVLAAILVVAVSGMVMAEEQVKSSIGVQINVDTFAEIDVPSETLELSIDNSYDNNGYEIVEGKITVKANYSPQVQVSSSGYGQPLNSYVDYRFLREGNQDLDCTPGDDDGTLTPNKGTTNYTIQVRLNEKELIDDDEWLNLDVDNTPDDTITLTISG